MVTIQVKRTIEPEDMEVRGNAIDSGNPADDYEVEEQILERLARGEQVAWCCARVEVSVEFQGETFTGVATLGGCSYDTEAQLWNDVAADLEQEARKDCFQSLYATKVRGETARRAMKELAGALVPEAAPKFIDYTDPRKL